MLPVPSPLLTLNQKYVGNPEVLLQGLKKKNLDAYIAGGYTRDAILNRSPKDLDIFIVNSDNYTKEDLEQIYTAENSPFSGCRFFPNYLDSHLRDDVFCVYKDDVNCIDYIIMNTTTIEEVIFNFDASICQCYAKLEDGKLNYYVSGRFKHYQQTGIIEVYTDVPSTEDHIERLKSKFPKAILQKTLARDMNKEVFKLPITHP